MSLLLQVRNVLQGCSWGIFFKGVLEGVLEEGSTGVHRNLLFEEYCRDVLHTLFRHGCFPCSMSRDAENGMLFKFFLVFYLFLFVSYAVSSVVPSRLSLHPNLPCPLWYYRDKLFVCILLRCDYGHSVENLLVVCVEETTRRLCTSYPW